MKIRLKGVFHLSAGCQMFLDGIYALMNILGASGLRLFLFLAVREAKRFKRRGCGKQEGCGLIS